MKYLQTIWEFVLIIGEGIYSFILLAIVGTVFLYIVSRLLDHFLAWL